MNIWNQCTEVTWSPYQNVRMKVSSREYMRSFVLDTCSQPYRHICICTHIPLKTTPTQGKHPLHTNRYMYIECTGNSMGLPHYIYVLNHLTMWYMNMYTCTFMYYTCTKSLKSSPTLVNSCTTCYIQYTAYTCNTVHSYMCDMHVYISNCSYSLQVGIYQLCSQRVNMWFHINQSSNCTTIYRMLGELSKPHMG